MTMKLESTHSYIKPTGELVCEIHKYRFEDGRKEYFPRRPRPNPDRTGFVPSEWLCGIVGSWYHRDAKKTHLWRRSDAWDGFMAREGSETIPMGFGRFNPPTCDSYHHVKSEYDSELIDDLEWAYFDGVERIPYNVNLWHQKTLDGHPLICVEGEKEADFLTKLGYCATTTLGGSKNRWTPSEGTWLAGRRVITVEDNDDTGRDYADSAVVQAIRAGAKEVRMVQSQHYACYANGSDLSACALQSEDPAVFVKMVLANAGQSWLPKPAAKVEPTDPVQAFAQHTEKAKS